MCGVRALIDGVLEGLPGEDVAGPDPTAKQFQDRFAGPAGEVLATGVDRGRRRAVGKGHADGLGHGCHRVRGVHARAGTGAGTRGYLELLQLFHGHPSGRGRAYRLEHVLDGDRLPPIVAGEDGASIEEHARHVDPRRGHQHARQTLVAAGDGNHGVEPLCVHDQFDRVGDDLARDQRGLHSFVPHGDGIRDSDGHELDGYATGSADAFLRVIGQSVEVHVARRHLVPGGGHSDLWPIEVLIGEADRPEHRPGAGAFHAFCDLSAPRLHGLVHLVPPIPLSSSAAAWRLSVVTDTKARWGSRGKQPREAKRSGSGCFTPLAMKTIRRIGFIGTNGGRSSTVLPVRVQPWR